MLGRSMRVFGLLGILGTALFALAGCSSDTGHDSDGDGQRTDGRPEIAFIRASGTRMVDETVRRTDAHVFVWRKGSAPEQITSGPGEDSAPAWSPGGETIFFSRARTRGGGDTFSEIYRVDGTGGRATRLTRCRPPSCTGDSEPRVSPDGRTLAFLRMGPGRSRIGTLVLPDGDLTFTSLPDRLKPYTSPSWRSVDQVTLSAYGPGTKVRAYQTTPALRPLEPLPVCEEPARCAAPGSISWSTDPAGEGALEATLGNDPAIYAVSDGPATDPAIKCFDGECPHRPAISPDGGRLAFDAGDDFGGDLYLSDSDGRSIRRITKGKDLDCCAVWRPSSAGGR